MDSLKLRIPPRQDAGDQHFDTRKAAVMRWAAELPLGNLGKSAQQLHDTLAQCNRQPVALAERAQLMELIATPLQTVLEGILEKMVGTRLPLSKQFLQQAAFVRQLLTEAITGYHILLESKQEGSWLFHLTHQQLWPTCMHRMLHLLGQLQLLQRLTHQACPPGLWHAVHRIYQRARSEHKHQLLLELPWESPYRETIEHAYIKSQLNVMIDPGLLSAEQFTLLQQHLLRWADLVSIREGAAWHAELAAYWLDLDSDSPHTSPAAETTPAQLGHADCLLLDLSTLQQACHEAEGKPSQAATPSYTPQTLHILAQAWQVPSGDRPLRQASHAQNQAAIGISALFSLLRNERRQQRDGISDQNFEPVPQLLLKLPGTARPPVPQPGGDKAGVWDTLFFASELGENSWSISGDKIHYRYLNVHIRDSSVGGYRLAFRNNDLQSLEAGELIGLRPHPGAPVQLCQARWVQQSDELVLCGTRLLAEDLEPMLCVMHHQKQQTPIAGLIGIARDGHAQLFLPNLPGLEHRQLMLVVDGFQIPILLQQRMAVSQLFTAHRFTLHPAIDSQPSISGKLSLAELNQRLHLLTHSQRDAGPLGDDFSPIRDSL